MLFRRWPGWYISTLIVGALAGGIIFFTQPTNQPPPAGTANIWIDQNASQGCVRSSTPIAYAGAGDTNSCNTFQAAQTAMSAGDVAIVRCGAYPAQSIATGGKASTVTLQAETYDKPTNFLGAYSMTSCVTVDSLDVNVDHIHIAGIEATPTPWTTRPDGRVLQFQDWNNCVLTGSNCSVPAGGAPGHLGVCQTPAGNAACASYTDVLIDYWKGPGGQIQSSGTTIDHSNFGSYDSCYLGSLNSYAYVAPNSSGNSQGTQVALGGDSVHFPWPGSSTTRVVGGITYHDLTALSNMAIRNSVFHDVLHGQNSADGITCTGFTSQTGSHTDQIQGDACANNCTIENTAFWNGGDKPIQWTQFGNSCTPTPSCSQAPNPPLTEVPMTNAFVQNNVLDGSGFNTSSSFGQTVSDCSGLFWQNNIGQGPNVTGCGTSPAIVRNNILNGHITSCLIPIAYSHNVEADITSTTLCGSGAGQSIKCAPVWANGFAYVTGVNTLRASGIGTAGLDPTLSSSDTCAKGFSDAAFPPKDIFGNDRPQGGAADAGPSEIVTAPADTSNIWVDQTGGTCQRSASLVAWVDSTACASIDAALAKAACGDVIKLRGGTPTYAAQTLNTQAALTNCSSDVQIKNTINEIPVLTSLSIQGADHLNISGIVGLQGGTSSPGVGSALSIGAGGSTAPTSTNITIDGWKGVRYNISGAQSFITIQNSEFGPYLENCPGGSQPSGSQVSTGTTGTPDHITIDHNLIHDITIDPVQCAPPFIPNPLHMDCSHILGATFLTWTNNTIRGCQEYDLLFNSNGGTAQNAVICNNFFGQPIGAFAAFGFRGGGAVIPAGGSEQYNTVLLCNNTMQNSVQASQNANTSYSSVTIANNLVGGSLPCNSQISYSKNLLFNSGGTGTPCSGDNTPTTTALACFINLEAPPQTSAFDMHVCSTSSALGKGNAAFAPPTDIDGIARPILPSAGADDLPDTTAPSVSITAPANGATVSGATTSVTANASDNVGVVGVQFKLDGVNLGAEDTTSTYGITWDTTTASNGSHTLTAVARDAAGNTTPSSGVAVTVNNNVAITGASLGQCSPSPCTEGALPTHVGLVNEVSLGQVFNDWANETRIYYYYIPQNLRCHLGPPKCATEDINHKPAAVFINSNSSSGYLTQAYWDRIANENKLIIIIPQNTNSVTDCVDQVYSGTTPPTITTAGTRVQCTDNWAHPQTDCDSYLGNVRVNPAGGGTVICNTSSINAADKASDIPYIVSVVNSAVPLLGLDASRLYMTGASKGGAMTKAVLCDSRSASLFRGYAPVSNGYNSKPTDTIGSCPAGYKNAFFHYASGPNDSQGPYNDLFLPGSCTVGTTCTHVQRGFTQSKTTWGNYFCPGVTGVQTSYGTPSALNKRYDFSGLGCAKNSGSPQVEFEDVNPNGGHGNICQDSFQSLPIYGSVVANGCNGVTPNTNGQFTALNEWLFFAASSG